MGNQNKNWKNLFWNFFKKSDTIEKESSESKEVLEENKEGNIFSELSWWLDFWQEEEKIEEKHQKKDKLYYLKKISSSIYIFNVILFFAIAFSALYIYIQKSNNFLDKSYLDGLCFFILWDKIDKTYTSCSSVSSLYDDYENKIKKLNDEIISILPALLEKSYEIENFINSKEVSFLFNKKDNRLKVLEIINDFDVLKNSFLKVDKKQIVCWWFEISDDLILKTSCEVYTSSWERWTILWSSWDKTSSSDLLQWTSISLAASFLNYIEKNPKYKFELLNKQEMFDSEKVLWEWIYTNKTKINLELKYNPINNLSL